MAKENCHKHSVVVLLWKVVLMKNQQIERSESLSCGSPTGLDSRDPFDMQLGARMLYNSQDALWRKKLEEQADLEHAIELQNRRLMELQLLEVKSKHHRAFSSGATIPFPTAARCPSFFSRIFLCLLIEAVRSFQKAANGSEQGRDSPSDENSNGKTSPCHDS